MGKDLSGKDLNLNWQDIKSECQYLNGKYPKGKDLNLNWQNLNKKGSKSKLAIS